MGNEPRSYLALYSLAEHLDAMLDCKDYMEKLDDEMAILQFELADLRQTNSTTALHEKDWEPRGKPRTEWTDTEVAFIAFENRLDAMSLVKEALETEARLLWAMQKGTLSLLPVRLRKLLMTALQYYEDIVCPYELNVWEEAKTKGSRCLGPMKLPPPAQALQLQEMRLEELISDGELDSGLKEIAGNQYHTVWSLKTHLISELFPTSEDLLRTSETRTFMLGSDWELWVVCD